MKEIKRVFDSDGVKYIIYKKGKSYITIMKEKIFWRFHVKYTLTIERSLEEAEREFNEIWESNNFMYLIPINLGNN